jgi:hypothetical protein
VTIVQYGTRCDSGPTYQITVILVISIFWGLALANSTRQISLHYPADKSVHFFKNNSLIFPQVTHKTPIPNTSLVFTDGSAKGVAAVVIDGHTHKAAPPCLHSELSCTLSFLPFLYWPTRPSTCTQIALTLTRLYIQSRQHWLLTQLMKNCFTYFYNCRV